MRKVGTHVEMEKRVVGVGVGGMAPSSGRRPRLHTSGAGAVDDQAGAGSEREDGGLQPHRGAAVSFERWSMEMRNKKCKSVSRTPVTDLSQPDCDKQMATGLFGTQVCKLSVKCSLVFREQPRHCR